MQCAQCGATNVADAEWCGQCYQPLLEVPAAGESTPVPSWTCPVCATENSYDVDVCEVCGTSLYAAFEESPSAATPRDALVAALVPGLGMARAGMAGEGLIAGILIAFAILGGGLILLSGDPLALVTVLGGLVLWAASARDAFVVASEGSQQAWLQPRTLTVIAVLILLMMGVTLIRAIPVGEST